MKIVMIKYNAGNVQSLKYALERIGITPVISDEPGEILSADKIIFPGVGEASSAMKYLKEKGLDEIIQQVSQPFLGICLGMQLMCSHSEENDTPCLGIFPEKVKLFKSTDSSQKIPQIGWNNIRDLKSDLFKNISDNSYSYFVHSYFADLGSDTIATSDYCGAYSSALHKQNFYGVQFHPEKSASVGESILKNFINL